MELILTRDSLEKTNQKGKHYLFAGLDTNLQKLYQNVDLPTVFKQALQDGIPWQIRAEITVERSILSPGSTYPWVAMLMALGTMVVYPDDMKKSLTEYMKQRTSVTGTPSGILIPLDLEHHRICYQAVRPTPAALPLVSVSTVFEVEKNIILNAQIAITGTWRNKLGLIQTAEKLIGKTLNEAIIPEAVALVLDEIKPVSNFQGSAEYRTAMAKVLTERALQQCLHQGEVAK
jgi:CO/xanthine dehydrogenase FAD-binding subunit